MKMLVLPTPAGGGPKNADGPIFRKISCVAQENTPKSSSRHGGKKSRMLTAYEIVCEK